VSNLLFAVGRKAHISRIYAPNIRVVCTGLYSRNCCCGNILLRYLATPGAKYDVISRFPTKVTKVCAYLAEFSRSYARQTDRRQTRRPFHKTLTLTVISKQVLPKVIWEEPRRRVPISYNGTPQIQPQNCPFRPLRR